MGLVTMMEQLFNNVTVQLVADDKTPIDEQALTRSAFLRGAVRFKQDIVVCPAAPELTKAEGLGHLWEDIRPRDGGFDFELATSLPFYLPNLRGRAEYVVKVGDADLVVSSRMVRGYLPDLEGHLDYILVHRLALPEAMAAFGDQLYPVPVPGFVSTQFHVKGMVAEDRIRANMFVWTSDLAGRISELIDAVRFSDPAQAEAYPLLPPLHHFWLLARGVSATDGSELQHVAQFSVDLRHSALRAVHNLEKEAAARWEKYLTASEHAASPEMAISLAKALGRHNRLGLAVVLVCTACESALAPAYRKYLGSRGISAGKIGDAWRDIGLSQLLNLHLPTMRAINTMPDHQHVLEVLDRARRYRNDYVHEGNIPAGLTRKYVDDAIHTAQVLVGFLKEPEESGSAA